MLAKLTVRLVANDTVVAESESPGLWASVLETIQAMGVPCGATGSVCAMGADDLYPKAPWMVRCDGVRTLFSK